MSFTAFIDPAGKTEEESIVMKLDLPSKFLWLMTLMNADAYKILGKNVKCFLDKDGECKKNVCLRGCIAGIITSKKALLEANTKALEHIKNNLKWEVDHDGKWRSDPPNYEIKTDILKTFIERLKQSKATTIFVSIEFPIPRADPCPRFFNDKFLSYDKAKEMQKNKRMN